MNQTICPYCAESIQVEAIKCRYCQSWLDEDRNPSSPSIRRLERPTEGRMITGVCASLANYLGVDVTLVRVIMVLIPVCTVVVVPGLLAYGILSFLIPSEKATGTQQIRSPHSDRLVRKNHEGMVGGVCAGLAERFGVDPTIVRIGTVALTFATAIVVVPIVYLILVAVIPLDSDDTSRIKPQALGEI